VKTLAAGLTGPHVATALKITRKVDAAVYAFTTHDVDDPIDGVTYSANPGLAVTDLVIAATAAVGNLDLTTLHDGTVFKTEEILGGAWDNADFILFRYDYTNLTGGIDTLLTGTLGESEIRINTVVCELRDLRQYLQQMVGSLSSKNCRYRLGSTDKNNGGLCVLDITVAPWSMPFTVTSVTSNQVFRDSARAEAVDYFGNGGIHWLTGPNAVMPNAHIKIYAADGTFTLTKAMQYDIAIGHTGTAIAGCRKRHADDCITKFDNVLNFGGEPHRRGLNATLRSPAANV